MTLKAQFVLCVQTYALSRTVHEVFSATDMVGYACKVPEEYLRGDAYDLAADFCHWLIVDSTMVPPWIPYHLERVVADARQS